jgi:hypothetical protein
VAFNLQAPRARGVIDSSLSTASGERVRVRGLFVSFQTLLLLRNMFSLTTIRQLLGIGRESFYRVACATPLTILQRKCASTLVYYLFPIALAE